MSATLWLLFFVLLAATSSWAQPETPELTRPVNDFANVIDPDSERQLESLIRALQETTGDVVVVATIDSLEGEDVYQYAERMFRNRGKGIGQAGKDNGLLVLAAVKDRQLKVEVGYDLEQFITDGFAGETIRQEIAPRFRQGAYGAGLVAGVQRIIGRIGEGRNVAIPGAPRTPDRRRSQGGGLRWKRLHSDDRPLHSHQRHCRTARPRTPAALGRRTVERLEQRCRTVWWRIRGRRRRVRRWIWRIRRGRRRIWWIWRRPQRRRRRRGFLVGWGWWGWWLVVSGWWLVVCKG